MGSLPFAFTRVSYCCVCFIYVDCSIDSIVDGWQSLCHTGKRNVFLVGETLRTDIMCDNGHCS